MGWSPSSNEWIKLNSDVSVRGSNYKASSGGLLRDLNGRWVGGYVRNIGSCSISYDELWGLLDGLGLAWDNGIRKLLVEVDGQYVRGVVTSAGTADNVHAHFIHDIKSMLGRDWSVVIQHIYCEGNRCANFMASLGATFPLGYHFFSETCS